MSYAIEILEEESRRLERCLSEWHCKEYPEAKKQRDNRLIEINQAITKIKNVLEPCELCGMKTVKSLRINKI